MSGARPDPLVKTFDFPLGATVEVSFVGVTVGRSESADRSGDNYHIEFKRPDGTRGRLWLPDFFIGEVP